MKHKKVIVLALVVTLLTTSAIYAVHASAQSEKTEMERISDAADTYYEKNLTEEQRAFNELINKQLYKETANNLEQYEQYGLTYNSAGCPRCDEQKLLKAILFAFMEYGISSLREIEKLCKNDIRYFYLPDDMKAPSFATFGNIIRNELTDSIDQIFLDVNTYIFEKDHVDLEHAYIDGTKIEANANRYTWVWKKSCTKNHSIRNYRNISKD